jgi:Raf kinase inhibitor-like YbhB/YbcL family protein
MRTVLRAVLCVALLCLACQLPAAAKTFELTSPAFKAGATIPHHYSYRGYGCDGDNVSPALQWNSAPSSTKAYALTLFDPDAMHGAGYWHWIVFDIPAKAAGLAENAGAAGGDMLPKPAKLGSTSFGTAAYGGPCPPVGDPPHHYIFTLYALDVNAVEGAGTRTTGPQLAALIKEHVIAKTQLVGRYGR